MQGALDWITENANALSGYVILLIGVAGLIWAFGTGRIYVAKNAERLVAEKDARIAKCEAALLQCEHPPGGSP